MRCTHSREQLETESNLGANRKLGNAPRAAEKIMLMHATPGFYGNVVVRAKIVYAHT